MCLYLYPHVQKCTYIIVTCTCSVFIKRQAGKFRQLYLFCKYCDVMFSFFHLFWKIFLQKPSEITAYINKDWIFILYTSVHQLCVSAYWCFDVWMHLHSLVNVHTGYMYTCNYSFQELNIHCMCTLCGGTKINWLGFHLLLFRQGKHSSSRESKKPTITCGKPVNSTQYDHLRGIANRNEHAHIPEPEVALIFKKKGSKNSEVDMNSLEEKLRKSFKEVHVFILELCLIEYLQVIFTACLFWCTMMYFGSLLIPTY